MKTKFFIFYAVFAFLFCFGAEVYGQEYPPIEIKSVGMLQSGTGNSLKHDLRIGLKNVGGKNVEINLVFLDNSDREIFNWKGYILPPTDEIMVKKSVPTDIIDLARYLNIRVSNANDQRNDYVASRFLVPRYTDGGK